MAIKSLLDALKELYSTTSTNEKVDILKKYDKSTPELKEFFELVLSDTTYGCKDKTWLKALEVRSNLQWKYRALPEDEQWDAIKNMCSKLEKNHKKLPEQIAEFIHNTPHEYWELLRLILMHDASCGVSKALASRVWSDVVKTGVQLCKAEPYSKKLLDKMSFPVIVQTKADGARCLCINGKFYSSSGKEFQGLEHLQKLVHGEYVLDGELVVEDNGKILTRKIGNGILNKSIKGTISTIEAQHVVYIVWDYIAQDAYTNGYDSTPYEQRYKALTEALVPNPYIRTIRTEVIDTPEGINKAFQTALSNGEEGIMVKEATSAWEGKRLKNHLKLKLDLDVTLKVIGWDYGARTSKYEKVLGKLHCASEDGLLSVSVGSGFSDEFRKQYAEDVTFRDEIKYIEVRSNGIIDCEGEKSLFLPRLVEVRYDKLEADTYATIEQLQNAAMTLK